jgi:hypothetical protein
MRGKLLVVLFICALVASSCCQSAAELLVKDLKEVSNPPALSFAITPGSFQSTYNSMDNQDLPDRNVAALLTITYEMYKFNNPDFQKLYQNYLYLQMTKLHLTSTVRFLKFHNWREGNRLYSKGSAVYAVVDRKNRKYNMKGLDGSGSITIHKEKLDLFESLKAEEWVERSLARQMLEVMRANTGLGMSQLRALGSSGKTERQFSESLKLRGFYSNVDFYVTDNDGADLSDLKEFIQISSNDNMRSAILNRIVEVSNSAGQSNFLFVARDRVMYYITVLRTHTYQVEFRSYTVEGGLPVGAFVTSTGSWNIENHGTASRLNVYNLMQEFRPSI